MTVIKSFKDLEKTREQAVRGEARRVCGVVMSKMIRGESVKHPHKLIRRGFVADVLKEKDYRAVQWLAIG